MNENNNNNNNTLSVNDEKVSFWLSMPFIWIISIISSFVLSIPGLVLFIIRLRKYPSKRTPAIISFIIYIVAAFLLLIIIIFSVTSNETKIAEEIDNGNYDHAIELIESNYTKSSYSYYSSLADVYEHQGNYDTAAEYLIEYVNKSGTSANKDAINRLEQIKNNCSDSVMIKVDGILNKTDIVEETNQDKSTVSVSSDKEDDSVQSDMTSEKEVSDSNNIQTDSNSENDSEGQDETNYVFSEEEIRQVEVFVDGDNYYSSLPTTAGQIEDGFYIDNTQEYFGLVTYIIKKNGQIKVATFENGIMVYCIESIGTYEYKGITFYKDKVVYYDKTFNAEPYYKYNAFERCIDNIVTCITNLNGNTIVESYYSLSGASKVEAPTGYFKLLKDIPEDMLKELPETILDWLK